MPLDATHLRFALDVKYNFKIDNLLEYLSGSIYPDSRFISKIPRLATHNDKFLNPDFYFGNDFKTGWAVHLICDRLFDKIVFQDFFSLVTDDFETDFARGGRINLTTLKFLEDRLSFESFPLLDFFPPSPIKAYNQEDIRKLQRYYFLIKEAYCGSSDYLINRMFLWRELGIAEEIVVKLKAKYLELNNNFEIMEKIKLIYPKMIKSFWEEYKI